jgi:prevent-host-death family protein
MLPKIEFQQDIWPEVYASRQNRSVLTWPVIGVEKHDGTMCLVVGKERVKGIIPLEESGIKESDNEILRDIAVGEPVFLTKNGRGKYVIVDITEYEKLKASLKLMSQLAQGELAGREKGWMTIEEVEAELGIEDV